MNRIQLFLLKLYTFGKIKETRYIKEIDEEIAIKKGRGYPQAVPFINVILFPESIFKDYDKETIRYFYFHEKGHKNKNYLISSILCLIAILSAIISTSAFFSSILLLVLSKYLLMGICLIYFLVFLLIFSGTSWYLEIVAERYAIQRLGKQKYKQIKERKRKKYNLGIFDSVMGRITHPPYWMYKKIFKIS